jgi:putative hemolysin
VALAEPLEGTLGFLGGASRPGSIVTVTVILAYITLVFGELAPKRLAMQRAERWGMLVARPLSAIARATRPVVWLLSRSTNLVVRLLGGDPSLEREAITEEELRDMIAAQLSFTPQQRLIISGAFEIAERTLNEILRPRREVFVLDADDRCRDALLALAASGHSRAPVCVGRSLDEVVGIVHLRDLLTDDPGCVVRDAAAPATLFPESAPVLDVLRQMQLRHVQLAVVISEHGGAEGIVTIEDLVEELVGEIYDETDRDVLAVRTTADGTLILPGRYPVHDLPDIGVDIPEGDYATLAGFVLARLGRLPDRPGDTVAHGPWRFTVAAVHRRAITEVRISRGPRSDHGDATASGR